MEGEVSVGPVATDRDENSLTRTSCHDSGIDIRESVPQLQTKKVYSDADVVLSSDFVPPLTIAPTTITTDTKTQSVSSNEDSSEVRKKTSSVSFSVEDNDNNSSDKNTGEVKKNKVRDYFPAHFYSNFHRMFLSFYRC